MNKKFNIETTSELMNNYKCSEIIDQAKAFKAVQTANQQTLFFGIGSDEQFYVIQETSGEKTGWRKIVLNNSLNGEPKSCHVSQNNKDGNIDIALVMKESSGKNVLYTRFDLSFQDLSWVSDDFLWNIMEDDRLGNNAQLDIVSVFLSDAKTDDNCLVVDVRNSSSQVDRYMINTEADQKWQTHLLPGNLTADTVISDYMGMPTDEDVVGVYTLGAVNQLVQCFFQPLYDPFGDEGDSAPATNFNLSSTGLTPENIAFTGCPSPKDPISTDLFFGGDGKLFYLGADQQSQLAKPVLILENNIFTDVDELHANSSEGRVVVWGLNHERKVFYTACNTEDILDKSAWSTPLPLFSEVASISTYLDLTSSAITLFANHGDNKLLKGVQDKKQGTWKFDKIELPAPDKPASARLSYSSTVVVKNHNNKAIPYAKVTLSAESYTTVYINHIYYRLGKEPVNVLTDFNGNLNIIEWIEGIKGTSINGYVELADNHFRLDPASIPINRLKDYDTANKLDGAIIKYQDGSSRKLLQNVSQEDTEKLGSHIRQLNLAYQDISGISTTNAVAGVRGLGDDVIDYTSAAAGDVLRYIFNESDSIIKLFKDGTSNVWHFVLKVGENIYGFVIDTIEKVANALESVWHAITGAVDDLVDFLKFLFDWEDMVLTKDVIKQVIKLNIHRIGEAIQDVKLSFDENIVETENLIQDWSNSPAENWPLPDKYTEAIGSLLSDFKNNELVQNALNSAPAQLLKSHFQSNFNASTINFPKPEGETGDNQITWDKLLDIQDLLDTEKQVLTNLIHHISDLFKASDNPKDPVFKELLMKIVGDVAIGSLELFKLMIDKVLDFVTLLIYAIPKALDAPMNIPVVTDILKDAFNIKMPSVLDVMTMVCAVPATLAYKALNNKAPFKKGDDETTITDKILAAKSYKTLKKIIDEQGIQDEINATMFEIGFFISGTATFLNGLFKILDEETQGGSGTVLQLPQSITSNLATFSKTAAKVFESPVSVKNNFVSGYQTAVTDLNTLRTFAFAAAPFVLKKVKGGETAAKSALKTLKLVDSGVESIFALALVVPPVFLIYEVVSAPETERTTLGMMDAVQTILGKVSTVVGFAALLDSEYLTKQVGVVAQGVLTAVSGGIQMEEPLVDRLFIEFDKI